MTITAVKVDGICPTGQARYRCCWPATVETIYESSDPNEGTDLTTYNVTMVHEKPDVEFVSYNVTKVHLKPDVEYMTYNVTKMHENPDVEYVTINGSKVHPGGRSFGKQPEDSIGSERNILTERNPLHQDLNCEFSTCKGKDDKDKCPKAGWSCLFHIINQLNWSPIWLK
jgi:hypothetical protein